MSLFHSNCFRVKVCIYIANMIERKNHSDPSESLQLCILSHKIYQFNWNKTGYVRCPSFRISLMVGKVSEFQGSLDGHQKPQ
jgi:hypothetical protein